MAMPIELQPVEEVPPGSRVVHYDELAEPAKERFPLLADGATADERVERALKGCDLVKFTEYYAVSSQP